TSTSISDSTSKSDSSSKSGSTFVSQNRSSRRQSHLPQTSETDNNGWAWLGTTLLALVGLGKKRKKDNED
ncbi:LPXTG cell wall anchor domain-containing protein, partial [Pediococcus pentosaceus]|uniref:LPXTG cell wall anchor domain-containing protein n=1 Tax=Pediococcus pentosaceus TaxID=1255 RepID=UPI00398297A8